MKALQISGILGIVISVAVVALAATGVIDMSLALTLIGVVGFSGLAALRKAILSSGYKTYIVAGVGFLTLIGFLAGVVDGESAAIMYSLLGIGSVGTVAHANKKAKGLVK